MLTRVVCLCCGSFYRSYEDCENYTPLTHSPAKAARVARYLLDRGCEYPRQLDVKDAIAALDAIDRG